MTKVEVWKFFSQFQGDTPPPSGPTSPPPPPSGTSAIRSSSANRCLDVNGASQANGSAVVLWDCHGQGNQPWTSNDARELRVYGSKCLDVNGAGTGNGTSVIIWDCHGRNRPP